MPGPAPRAATPTTETATESATLARLAAIERSLERYGCFDLVEDDVAWLIRTLRESITRRSGDT